MLDEQGFVLCGLQTDRGEELFVLLVFTQQGVVWTDQAGPEGAEELGFKTLLGVAFADDGALKVEELAVYVFEQGEQGGRVCELGIDAFFEYVQELVEGAVQCL